MNKGRILHCPEKWLIPLRQLLETHLPNIKIWAYGSRVKGNHHEVSDLDLVAFLPKDDAQMQMNLAHLRTALSESNIPIIVEVFDWNRLPVAFHNEIIENYVIVQDIK